MLIRSGIENMISLRSAGQFGLPCEFGCIMPAYSKFGDEPYYFPRAGKTGFLMSGIYQRRHSDKRVVTALLRYMIPRNPRTDAQKVVRQKYADGIVAWRGLTIEQKNIYNKNARGKKMSGYNLFLRDYLRSS